MIEAPLIYVEFAFPDCEGIRMKGVQVCDVVRQRMGKLSPCQVCHLLMRMRVYKYRLLRARKGRYCQHFNTTSDFICLLDSEEPHRVQRKLSSRVASGGKLSLVANQFPVVLTVTVSEYSEKCNWGLAYQSFSCSTPHRMVSG